MKVPLDERINPYDLLSVLKALMKRKSLRKIRKKSDPYSLTGDRFQRGNPKKRGD